MADVKNTVRKLYRLAQDRGPGSPEGQTAYRKARQLMAKHGLETKDIFPKQRPRTSSQDPFAQIVTGLRDLFNGA